MATKFVSALTGPEMDQALIDMAYHNSEAYAVGTRNGVAVGSSDVTYHNNSKYWAEQVYGYTDRAEDAANRAEAAVPSGTAGAVFFDRAQTLTTAQQAQARANIMAGGSNRNLLDNAWWGSGEAVNQRNTQSKPSNGSYTIDRWILTSGADVNQWAIGANGITFTIARSSIWYTQRTPNPSAWSGKTLTASVLLNDGTIKSGSAAFTYGTAAIFYNDSAINLSMNTSGQFVLAIRSTQTIRAVKLELGSVSTLANDAPPDYAEELAKCQRYFWRLGGAQYLNIVSSAMAESSGAVFGVCRFPVPMRAMPSISTSGAIVAWSNTSTTMQAIPVTLSRNDNSSPTTNPTFVGIRATGSGFTVGQRYDIQIRNDASGYVDFSADL